MAKKSNCIFTDDPIKFAQEKFKAQRADAIKNLRVERRAFYDKVAAVVRNRVSFSADYADIGDGKGCPMICKADINAPGEIKVSVYLLKSGKGDVISRTQNEICLERSLWFKPIQDKEKKKRVLRLEKRGDVRWEVKKSNLFQTIILKTSIVPKQAELDRLFDPEPLKRI
jgi:hypothetical protein